jgi:hypothetical protein
VTPPETGPGGGNTFGTAVQNLIGAAGSCIALRAALASRLGAEPMSNATAAQMTRVLVAAERTESEIRELLTQLREPVRLNLAAAGGGFGDVETYLQGLYKRQN